MKKGAFWPNFLLFGHFIIFVMSIYKFLKLGKFTEHTTSFAKQMKLLYGICLILSCDMRKGHLLPKFGKKYSFIKIYTWRNNCTCCSVYLLSCLPHIVNRKPIFMGALYIVTYFQEMEKGPPIPTKLHVDSGNFDQSVALTQSELNGSSISTVRWCVCICHFVGLAVSLLNDKHS